MFRDFSPHQTDARAAYAAGLMDGEGCISIQETHRKGYFYVSVDVGMTVKALPVLRWMRSTFGGTVLARRAATEKWAAAWTWRIGGAAAGGFLRRILPALLLKAENARVAIALCELVERAEKHPNGRAIWTEEMRAEGKRLKDAIHALNRKGPDSPEKAGEWFARLVAGLWITPQQTLDGTSEPFSETWPPSGWMRSGRCSELTTLELRTAASGSGSSPIYPTPSATEYGSSQKARRGSWPTPTQHPEAPNLGANRVEGPNSLAECARNGSPLWPTPNAMDAMDARSDRALAQAKTRGGCSNLKDDARIRKALWPTPRAEDSESTGAHRGEPLAIQVLWPTPCSTDANGAGSRNVEGSLAHAGVSLTDAVRGDGGRGRCRPPAASDEKGSAQPGQRRGQLSETVAGLKLNPDWVEFLMNWPVGWTSLEPLDDATALPWDVDPGDTGDVPRTTGGCANRRARLRAIGNGQVPQCAAAAFRLLAEALRERAA